MKLLLAVLIILIRRNFKRVYENIDYAFRVLAPNCSYNHYLLTQDNNGVVFKNKIYEQIKTKSNH